MQVAVGVGRDGEPRQVIDSDDAERVDVLGFVEVVREPHAHDAVGRHGKIEIVDIGALQRAHDGAAVRARVEPPIPSVPAVDLRT